MAGKLPGVVQVQTAVWPICQAALNIEGECVSCLLRVGLGAAADPDCSAMSGATGRRWKLELPGIGAFPSWSLGTRATRERLRVVAF